jgi:hypothetical protein
MLTCSRVSAGGFPPALGASDDESDDGPVVEGWSYRRGTLWGVDDLRRRGTVPAGEAYGSTPEPLHRGQVTLPMPPQIFLEPPHF